MKVERYNDERQVEREGKRIGYLVLNLNEFIGQPLKILTFKMDKEGYLILTVKISVVEYSENSADILSMSMRAVMTAKMPGTRSTLGPSEIEDDTSDEEVQGESLMNTYRHFHDVHK